MIWSSNQIPPPEQNFTHRMSQPKVSKTHHPYGAVGGNGSGPAVACREKHFHIWCHPHTWLFAINAHWAFTSRSALLLGQAKRTKNRLLMV
ncbi:hypothetical protein [Algoriphagus marinus]|uniref:hypothetical protein n=1 Tax=Algoriphagus marinus TaxID=1925762 RepID=UPI0011154295|nr:hypothetical protein [Algoriphagus marinus]